MTDTASQNKTKQLIDCNTSGGKKFHKSTIE